MGTELLPMATQKNRGKMWWISFALYYWKIVWTREIFKTLLWGSV